VWFDREQLDTGDPWRQKILRGLRHCLLFVPVVSRTTLRDEFSGDFFWLEWNAAHRRAAEMREDRPFIVPVAIDDTPPEDERLPSSFADRQWERLPAGTPSERFLDRVHDLYRQAQRLAQQRRDA
jgi:hypothetical protein